MCIYFLVRRIRHLIFPYITGVYVFCIVVATQKGGNKTTDFLAKQKFK